MSSINFEQEIHNQNNARRINILKGFSDFSENSLQKSEEGSELEKGHMDFSTQRVYADNSINRKLNRVGQKYGGRNVEDEKGVDKKDNSEESEDKNKPNPPQEAQPNEQGQYSTEQLVEFASEAEDWQLQEFLDNAKKSGDNSEYMQAQVNIAKDELNRRTKPSSDDVGKGVETDAEDLHNQENRENEDKSGLPDWNDIEGVKNFLRENPEVQSRFREIVEDDLTIRPIDAIKLAVAETSSGNEALQTVEEAKNMLDELHAKLGGGSDVEQEKPSTSPAGEPNRAENSEEEDEEDYETDEYQVQSMKDGHLLSIYDDEDEWNGLNEIQKDLVKKEIDKRGLMQGEKKPKSNDTRDFLNDYDEVKTSNFSIGQKIKFNSPDGREIEGIVADNNEYIKNGMSDGIGIEVDGEIIGVPTGEIISENSNPDNATEGIEGDEHHMMKVQRGKDKNK